MDPISGGNTEKAKPTISEISQRLNNIDVSDSDKLSQELAGLTNDVNAEIRDAFEDGKITRNESTRLDLIMSNLCGFNGRIKMAMQKATEDVKNTYAQLTANVSDLISRLAEAMNGRDPDQLALEPTETDADVAEATIEVPSRMYWKANQSDLEGVYEALVNPQGRRAGFYNRPQVKIGGLLGFVAEYSNRLDKKQVAFIRQYIQNLNEISKQQREDETPTPQAFGVSASNLPDVNKVKAYWNAIKSAGYSHNLESELIVLGYSKQDAKKLASQV